jgi:hypothetical protein
MQKIPTLFQIEYKDIHIKTDEYDKVEKIRSISHKINPECTWITEKGVKCYRKRDGSACAVITGQFYKRYDAKLTKDGFRKPIPPFAIPCQDAADPVTNHWPMWIPVDLDAPENKWHKEAWDVVKNDIQDGTYELCGPKINGNPEGFRDHILIPHNSGQIVLENFEYETVKLYLATHHIEGIVFVHPDGRMCKIKRKDVGFKWP